MHVTNRLLTLLILPLLVISSYVVSAAPAGYQPGSLNRQISASEYSPDSQECRFLELINGYRASIGQPALTLSRSLGAAAENHSTQMAAVKQLAHEGIGDGDVPTRIKATGYPLVSSGSVPGKTTAWWGENIYGYSSSAQNAFDAWHGSSGHLANMGRSQFKAIGISRVQNTSTGRWYWTTDFGGIDHLTVSCSGSGTQPTATSIPQPTATVAASGPTKLAVVSAGRTSNSTTAQYAYDSSMSTAWSTNASTPPSYAYFWLDFGSVKTISQIKWRFSNICCADSYLVQVSTDRSNWKTISTRSAPTVANSFIYKNWSGQARYVRFYFTNPNGDANIGYVSHVVVYTP